MNKRGLSNIVATVLIILLTLGSVILAWALLQPIFSENKENILLENKCLKVSVEATSCTAVYNSQNGKWDITLTSRYLKGNVTKITEIIELEDSQKKVFVVDAPELLETKTSKHALATTKRPIKFRVSAVVSSDSGKGMFTCDPINEVECI